MKKILGLDLGTNSIGWALIEINHEKKILRIISLGSRIIPMDATELGNFEKEGIIQSAAAQRTEKRGPRRLNERFILRRNRLHLLLNLLEALPEHYKIEIDFERNGQKSGKFKHGKEPKLAYKQNKHNPNKYDFQFSDAYQEMLDDMGIENVKGKRVPYDWTLYYLRKKALDGGKLTLNELAWVLLSYNQKRGYEKTEVENKSIKDNELIEELDLKVTNVSKQKQDINGRKYYEVSLEGNDIKYKEYSDKQMTFKNDLKEVIKTTKLDEEGYEKEKTFKVVDIYPLTIESIEYKKEDGKHNFTLHFTNGWSEIKKLKNYTFKYKNIKGKTYDYIVETEYDENGDIKTIQGKERKFREPDFSDKSNDWTLLKKKTEKEALKFNVNKKYIDKKGNPKHYISPDIYETLKTDAVSKDHKRTKIIGGKFQVVDRKFYREELNDIINNQKKYHPKLEDQKLINDCIKLLYPNNGNHRKLLENKKAIEALLVDDILLYQRPLKSKKSEIANCKYEIKYWKTDVDKETGEILDEKPIYNKVVPASHPLFQEFRIWDKIHNLKLIEKEPKDSKRINVDVTKQFFKTPDDYQKLFDFFNNQKTVTQSAFLSHCKKEFGIKTKDFKWNFPEDEELKGNETRTSFITRFKRCGFDNYDDFLTLEKEIALWHYLYSVSYNERTANNKKSLKKFFNNYFKDFNDITEVTIEKLVNDFANYPKFDSKYAAYSHKALSKLLPFMQMGNNRFKGTFTEDETKNNKWKKSINERIETILQKLKQIDFTAEKPDFSEVEEKGNLKENILPFPKGLFNVFKDFENPEDFSALNLTQASYLVYGRHSELAQEKHWNSPQQIIDELHKELKHNSLNNPIAEKVLLEMMQVVAEIWKTYGEKENEFTYKKLFDRIHVEVGRELKKSAKEKKKISKNQTENRKQNKRLRQILQEFLSNNNYKANPKNNDHFERLKILENGARIDKKLFIRDKDDDGNINKLKQNGITQKDINSILKKETITKQEFDKYKLWIEQGYRSPYTGLMIKLTDLFDGNKYNIDHIFPQALISNDSLTNKVVCETEINKLKSNQTGRDFILNPKKRKVFCAAYNREVEILTEENYISLVKEQFAGQKREILLSKEIPSKFINSQLNTSRHIARKAVELLSHIVREKGEIEYRSKNVLPVTGMVTNKLKRAWKLDHVWKELVTPRFIRMNELTKSNLFGDWREIEDEYGNIKKYFDCQIDETILEKMGEFDIKRIDHRHHALDALVVALCTEEHVNYLNNINANAKKDDYGKQKQLEKYRLTLKKKIKFSKPKKNDPKENDWFFMLPAEKRQPNAKSSSRDTVIEMKYQYKGTGFDKNYKKMMLTALQDTIVTFKQNKRVINKTVNKYNKWDKEKNKVTLETQKPKTIKEALKSNKKYNWAIRRSLGKDTFYGKVFLGDLVNKELHKSIDIIFSNPTLIVDENLRKEVIILKKQFPEITEFTKQIKNKYVNKKITLKVEKMASRYKGELSKEFNSDKIKNITDTGIQKILLNHLKQFDTIKLPFDEAIKYYDALLEKDEFEAIVNDNENDFKSTEELIQYLKNNKYESGKTKYATLNVFVDKVTSENLRNRVDDKEKKIEIIEHPEIAFTPEEIEKMNEPYNLIRLNNGKNHKPIYKVRLSSGFGKQRQVTTDKETKHPVKLKQYMVNDEGSNIFIGVYENKETTERKFKGIELIELIETLKQAAYNHDLSKKENPIPDKYDNDDSNFGRIFTLSPLDLVYVPTEEELNSEKININTLDKSRIYKLVKFSGQTLDFVPANTASVIFDIDNAKGKNNKFLEKLGKRSKNGFKIISPKDKKLTFILNEIGKTSRQSKSQNTLDGIQIKSQCWKLTIDRLGNIIKIEK